MFTPSRSVFLLLTLVLFIWLAGFAAFSCNVTRQGLISPSPEKTDAIIVLTGGPDRVNAGLDLLEQKKSAQLFISGVHKSVTLNELILLWRPDSPVVMVPCCITLGRDATNTTQNARESATWIMQNKISSIRLLTAAYLMPRAQLEFKDALPADVTIIPHPLTTRAPAESEEAYHRLLFSEYNKTLLTWFRTRTKMKKS